MSFRDTDRNRKNIKEGGEISEENGQKAILSSIQENANK